MKSLKQFVLMATMFALSACGPKFVSKQEAYPLMYEEKPLSLVVLPPINQSTAAEARDYYSTTIAEPLALRGYYVFPLEVVTAMLEHEGVYDSESILNFPPQKLKEYFGADAAMFIVISKWDTSYYVIGGKVKVSIAYMVKSTTSGETIWKYNDTLEVDTSGKNRGGGLGGLVLAAVETAVKTAMTDYVPIAQRLNNQVLQSIPLGKYHTLHGQDMAYMVVPENQIKPEE